MWKSYWTWEESPEEMEKRGKLQGELIMTDSCFLRNKSEVNTNFLKWQNHKFIYLILSGNKDWLSRVRGSILFFTPGL